MKAKQKHSTGWELHAVVFFLLLKQHYGLFLPGSASSESGGWRPAVCTVHPAASRVLSNFSHLLSNLLAEHTCPWCHVAHQKPANARDKLKGLILHTAVSLQVWLLMVIPTNPSSKSIATSSKQNIPLDLFTCAQSPWNAKSKHNESRPSIIVARKRRVRLEQPVSASTRGNTSQTHAGDKCKS